MGFENVMPHQYRMAGFLSAHNRGFCLAEPGTGKTACATWALDFLIGNGFARRALVVCPTTLMHEAWSSELTRICPARKHRVITGSKEKRAALLAAGADIDIINYDGVEVVFDALKAVEYDIIIIDESTAYKNINRRWEFMRGLVNKVAYLWMLTGTPTPQSPEDAYGQVKLMHGDNWKVTKTAWKYSVMQQVSQYRWIPKTTAAASVREVMQPAVFVSKKDALPDMPPLMITQRNVALSVDQTKLIKQLKKDSLATSSCGASITAVHAAVLMSKICQIASGSVYDEIGNIVHIDNSARDAELINIIEQTRSRERKDGTANNKVIVFCAFKHTIARVAAMINANGFRAEAVTGDDSLLRRQEIFGRVQRSAETEVLVAIPEIASHGLTLTAATTTVWFSPITKADCYGQAEHRMNRPGQKQHMEVIRLYGCEPEKLMYNNLSQKQTDQRDVLSGYSQLVASL
jgi:SNF2 family DNA or RNA helicase